MADHLLVIPRLKVQNANAISSAMTWGFPSMTSFVGLMHALERRLSLVLPNEQSLFFNSIGVVCHKFEPQVSDGFIKYFHLTRNPLRSNGQTAPIVEEGRCHIEISLVFSVGGEGAELDDNQEREALAVRVKNELSNMRIAGGSVVPSVKEFHRSHLPEFVSLDSDEDARSVTGKRTLRKLLPGFALVLREDRLAERLDEMRIKDTAATSFDAWLDLSRLNYECRLVESAMDSDHGSNVKWEMRRKPGWGVPIPIGYRALSEKFTTEQVANTRDSSTPLQFAESVYSIGEWKSPHRLKNIKSLLWYIDNQVGNNVYRLKNDYVVNEI